MYAREHENEGGKTTATIKADVEIITKQLKGIQGECTLLITSRGETKIITSDNEDKTLFMLITDITNNDSPAAIKAKEEQLNKALEMQRNAQEQQRAQGAETDHKAPKRRARKELEEQQRKAQEEQQRKAQEEAQRKAQEEAQRKAQEEQQRKALERNGENTVLTLDKIALRRIDEIASYNREIARLKQQIAQAQQYLARVQKTVNNIKRKNVGLSVQCNQTSSYTLSKRQTAPPPIIPEAKKEDKPGKGAYIAANITLVTLILGAIGGLICLVF